MSGAGGYVIAFAALAIVYGLYTLADRLTGSIGSKLDQKLDKALHRAMPIDDDAPEDDK